MLGTYECELFPAIGAALAAQPDIIINVGSAEGYYAIGLTRAAPHLRVYAFDISDLAQRTCLMNARDNGVADRIIRAGKCDPSELVALLNNHKRPFVLMDCEGAELDLLTGSSEALRYSTVLVECHDFIVPGVTDGLKSVFCRSHSVMVIQQGGRNPHSIRAIQDWGEPDRWIILSERRPVRMHWLYITPSNPSEALR